MNIKGAAITVSENSSNTGIQLMLLIYDIIILEKCDLLTIAMLDLVIYPVLKTSLAQISWLLLEPDDQDPHCSPL